MTVNIELINDRALNLLSELERLNLIRLNIPVNNGTESKEKLSELFAGSLRLSDIQYEVFQNTLQEGRKEWNRDIC